MARWVEFYAYFPGIIIKIRANVAIKAAEKTRRPDVVPCFSINEVITTKVEQAKKSAAGPKGDLARNNK